MKYRLADHLTMTIQDGIVTITGFNGINDYGAKGYVDEYGGEVIDDKTVKMSEEQFNCIMA